MILINDKTHLDMSYLLDVNVAAELDAEISLGLARTKDDMLSVGYEFSRGDAALDLYDPAFKDVGLAEKELTPAETAELGKMSFNEKQKYLKFAKGAYFPWAVTYSLLNDGSWDTKMNASGKFPTPEAEKLFPKTLAWCYAVPIFEKIGRIVIYGVDPCQHITCHRDHHPGKYQLDDELLMVSPRGNKKFYLYNPETGIKEYVDARAFIFHDLNYHGVDALKHFSYNFRIDGVYTDEFKKTLQIKRP